MKGPLSATMVAATAFEPAVLKKPIYIVITADEELGLRGAKRLIHTSDMLKRDRPEWGIVAEPTSLVPIYAHKGMGVVEVIAQGRAAHSATGLGESALLKIAPFLRDLHEIDQLLQSDTSFQDDEFVPAHHTINPIIDIGEAAMNVTAAQAIVRVSVRMMPNARSSEAVEMIAEKARGYGFETAVSMHKPMYVERDSALVTMCETVTGEKAQTVSFGTDGAFLQEVIEQIVVMGPGDIGVAHTVNEHVSIRELYRAVDVYKTLIQRFCI